MLYVGTERGVVFSTDDGKTWQSLQLNLPTVPVHDLVVKGDDLVVGSHGRSLWIFDDLTPIRTFGPAIANKSADLLPPLVATRWRLHGSIGAVGRGENPPSGAIIHFWLKDKPKAKPKLEILDADGKLVRALGKPAEPEPTAVEKEGDRREGADRRGAGSQGEGSRRRGAEEGPVGHGKPKLPDKAGLHRVVWDLEYDPARPIKNAKIDSGSPETAPLALPGKYTVRLTVDGHALTAALEVRLDPRVKAPLAGSGRAGSPGAGCPRRFQQALRRRRATAGDSQAASGS